jgi:hypothetical protein
MCRTRLTRWVVHVLSEHHSHEQRVEKSVIPIVISSSRCTSFNSIVVTMSRLVRPQVLNPAFLSIAMETKQKLPTLTANQQVGGRRCRASVDSIYSDSTVS